MSHRVFVTGLGQVSALGTGVESFSDAVFAGRYWTDNCSTCGPR